MPPVPWVTTSPELVEQIVAVMLSRENERARRIRPSKGDGGLDVVVPTGRKLPGPAVDYQVKYFATNLTTNQKSQVEHSLLSARNTHVDPGSGYTIDQWLLTLPLDETREQSTWLAGLATTHEIPFPVEWRGLSFLDGLAAKYPDVIDYYLAEGRARLESSIKLLRGLVDLPDGSDPGHLLLPADVHEPLSKLFLALNHDDPHYSYEYELTAKPPPGAPRPGLVASASRTENGVCITVHIIARYELATEDAPIPISIRIDPSTMDEKTKAAWESALKYGTPVELGDGVASHGEIGLPAGLGWSGPIAGFKLGAATSPTMPGGNHRWCILPPGQGLAAPIAEVLINGDPPTSGPAGGTQVTGQDSSGFIRTQILMDGDSPNATLSLTLSDPTEFIGRPVQQVLPALRFATAWHEPNRLLFAPEYGPLIVDSEQPIQTPPELNPQVLRYSEDLAIISERTGTPISVPDLTNVSPDDYNTVRGIAELLQGGSVPLTASGQVIMVAAEEVERFEAQAPVARTYPYPRTLPIAGASVPLPKAELRLPEARLVRATDAVADEHGQVPLTIVPVGESPAIVVLTP
jgi:hypothetical protein